MVVGFQIHVVQLAGLLGVFEGQVQFLEQLVALGPIGEKDAFRAIGVLG